MNQTRAGIYFIILVFAFFGLLFSQTRKEEKPSTIAQTPSNEHGKVLAGGSPCYQIFIKDISNNNNVADASVILNSPRSSFNLGPYQNDGNSWKFAYNIPLDKSYQWWGGVCPLASGVSAAPVANVTISKSGYETKTTSIQPLPTKPVIKIDPADTEAPSTPTNLKTTSVKPTSATLSWTASTDNKAVAGYKIFRDNVLIYTTTATSFTDSSLKADKKYSYFVKAYDAAGNFSSASNTITITTTLTIEDVSLPKIFGGSTTNLAKISDAKKVQNLTIEVKDKNKIVWNETVDLSSQDTANKFKSLDKYIKAEQLGVLELDSKTLNVLNKKASVTMFNLPFISTPKVLVDGKEDPETVSDINYADGNLTFNTTHFTKFEAVPTLTIIEPQNGFETNEPLVTLRGIVGDPQATVSASLNNEDLGALKVATQSGQFSKRLTLTEGNNTIVIMANSLFGATLSATISGTYTPDNRLVWVLSAAGIGLIGATIVAGVYYWYKRNKARTTQSETKSP
ncbi:MAG: hypothetical protein Q8O75_03350 [bacterium]|nr:hypothetical protein [bacterium]